MDAKLLNTTYDYEFVDGTTAKLTLAFYYLYKLRSTHKKLYERYNKIMLETSKNESYDEINQLLILYTAYVCANMDDENLMSEEDFIMQCGSDREQMGKALQYLTAPKKA